MDSSADCAQRFGIRFRVRCARRSQPRATLGDNAHAALGKTASSRQPFDPTRAGLRTIWRISGRRRALRRVHRPRRRVFDRPGRWTVYWSRWRALDRSRRGHVHRTGRRPIHRSRRWDVYRSRRWPIDRTGRRLFDRTRPKPRSMEPAKSKLPELADQGVRRCNRNAGVGCGRPVKRVRSGLHRSNDPVGCGRIFQHTLRTTWEIRTQISNRFVVTSMV